MKKPKKQTAIRTSSDLKYKVSPTYGVISTLFFKKIINACNSKNSLSLSPPYYYLLKVSGEKKNFHFRML